jgi:hypothetical protein
MGGVDLAFILLSLVGSSDALILRPKTLIPIAAYCQRYLEGIAPDVSDFRNSVRLYQASVQVSAKGHSNAEQPPLVDGVTTYAVYPDSDQLYGGDRYTVHLIEVEAVLRRFGYSFSTPRGRALRIASRLHDLDEDTRIKLLLLQRWFGAEIAGLVKSVTKIETADPAESKRMTIENVLTHPDGVILKLADRIANVEKGIRERGILKKYLKDHVLFRSILYKPGQADAMWAHLDQLIKDQAFPSGVTYWDLRLKGLDYELKPQLEGELYRHESLRNPKMQLPHFAPAPQEAPRVLNIGELHFMQRYSTEQMDNRKFSVVETAHALKDGDIDISFFPPIEVWRDSTGKVWSLDHRRLAAYRLSGLVKNVPVKWVDEAKVRADAFKFEPYQDGRTIQILLEDGRVILPTIGP